MDSPPNDLDARALGRAASAKGSAAKARACAEETEAPALRLSGHDEALADGAESVTGGFARHPVDGSAR